MSIKVDYTIVVAAVRSDSLCFCGSYSFAITSSLQFNYVCRQQEIIAKTENVFIHKYKYESGMVIENISEYRHTNFELN